MIVNPFARVTALSADESGVPAALEDAPVIAFAPENAIYAPTEVVPKSEYLS